MNQILRPALSALTILLLAFATGCSDSDSGDEPDFTPVIEQDISSEFGQGFVWFPESRVTKTLVILTASGVDPTTMELSGAFGEEKGQYLGRTNGNRPTFLFSRPGCLYGNNIRINTNGGASYFIPDGCNRYDI